MVMIEFLVSRSYFLGVFVLLAIGSYMMIANRNIVKKIIGMNVFQSAIFLFFIVSAYIEGASSPVVSQEGPFVSPLPHVLILTAIVVGVSLTAVALGLVVRIYGEYGTLDETVLKEVMGDD